MMTFRKRFIAAAGLLLFLPLGAARAAQVSGQVLGVTQLATGLANRHWSAIR